MIMISKLTISASFLCNEKLELSPSSPSSLFTESTNEGRIGKYISQSHTQNSFPWRFFFGREGFYTGKINKTLPKEYISILNLYVFFRLIQDYFWSVRGQYFRSKFSACLQIENWLSEIYEINSMYTCAAPQVFIQ